ncbi:MAG: Glycerol operon regulatory protein [Syntrophorhabdus sp. PtaU1.Bin058]|nr:MAG: Glycerol operon regulatory protein [Syntrophorhabdus sp. PtaU1.Bin058]
MEQGLQILLFLQQYAGEKMSLTKICQGVGIHNSKGHYLLATLQAYGFVEKDPYAKTYMLGARMIPLARAAIDHLDYRAAAVPFVEELAGETGGTAWFGLRMNESLFVLCKHEGKKHFWATPGIGQTFDFLTTGAHGKTMLAFLPDEERALFFKKHKDIGVSLHEIASIKNTGFAKDFGTFFKGLNAVAAPVFASGRQLIGVLLVFGTFPVKMADMYGRKTADAAKRLSAKLGC